MHTLLYEAYPWDNLKQTGYTKTKEASGQILVTTQMDEAPGMRDILAKVELNKLLAFSIFMGHMDTQLN